MAFMCPHLIEQYFVKVSEILYTYKPQIVLLVNYKDVSDGLILRGSLRKEEHDVIIKMKNSKSQIEALLLIIPKRMWGLENFITVLIDQNVNSWLMEEMFQSYVRHLVNSIKKQQAEKKCECLQLKDGSYFRRRWIQALKIFDAWIYNVGTSLGFMSQTLYPVNNSLAFINNKIPLPLPRKTAQQLLQLQYDTVGYSDDQSVTVTEIDDDDVFEQENFNSSAASATKSQRNQIIGMIPRETIAKPIRAITNGLIINPLKALNISLTRSVDCLANLTSSTLPITDLAANKCAVAYPLHKINTGMHSGALVSARPSMMSTSFKSQNIFSNSLSEFSFNSPPGLLVECNPFKASINSVASSPLTRISQKYSIGTSSKSAVKIPLHNGPTTPITSSSPNVDPKSPKSSSMITPSRSSSSTSSAKSLSRTLKSSVSQNSLTRSSDTVAKSSPSLQKSTASQKLSTSQSKTVAVPSKFPAVSPPKSSTKSATTESIPELFEDLILSVGGEFDIIEIEANPESSPSGSSNTRNVGTNTIFHHSTVQQNLMFTPKISAINKPKSISVSSTSSQSSSVTPRLSQSSMTSKTSPTNKEKSTAAAAPSTLNRSLTSVSNRSSPRLSDPSVKLKTTIPQTKSTSEISSLNRSSHRLSDPSITLTPTIILDKNETMSTSESSTLNLSSPTLSSPTVTLTPEITQENEIKSVTIPDILSTPEFPELIDLSVLSPTVPQTSETQSTPATENLSQISSALDQMRDITVTTEIPASILSSPKLSDEGISMSSSETVNSPNEDSVRTTFDDVATKENSTAVKFSLSKSTSLPNAESSSKGASSKGSVKRSISSVFDRLSKPKTKSNVPETKEKSLSTSDKMAAGRNDLKKLAPSSHKKLASTIHSIKPSESKLETNLAVDVKNIVSAKTSTKVVPPRPKFNSSTKIKPPPPPPPMYERLSPEDYASQQMNLEWLKKWDDAELVPAT